MRNIIVALSLLLIGCSNPKESKEFRNFHDKYGSETRTYCEDGFKMRETFIFRTAKAPQVFLIDSQDCKERR